jgi:thioredoxin 1
MGTDVNSNNFEREVLQSSTPVLVDFFADWCQPCKMLAPVLDRVRDKIKVVKINIDDSSASGLAKKYRISSLPTLLFFKKGQEVHRIVGLQSESQVLNHIHYVNAVVP